MYKLSYLLSSITLLISCQENTKIGRYAKESLPENFFYEIIKDESDKVLEKNQLEVEISQKLTEGQIASLAEELYNSKDPKRRFYIFYKLKGVENTAAYWAISLDIMGSTTAEDINKEKISEKIDGELIGEWDENKYTFSKLMIYKKDDKIFIWTIYINGQVSDIEIIEKKIENGIRYDYKDGGYNGEYFILNNQSGLELYNRENKKFTTAMPK